MPPPALAPSGAPSRSLWGTGPEDSEFPRSASVIPARHRSRGASGVAASDDFFPFGVDAAVGQRRKRINEGHGDTIRGDLRTFRGNPLAPFSSLQGAEDKASLLTEEDQFPSDAVGVEETVSSAGARITGLMSSPDTLLQPLAGLVSIPVGSLLLGVVAEIHSDDILVHLPDGVVGWISRSHALPSLEDLHGRNGVEQGQSVEKGAKRRRRDSARGTVPAGESTEVNVSPEETVEATAPKQHALTRVADGHAGRRRVSLTNHYAVGQIVQCVVIADGEDEGPQQRPDPFRSRGGPMLTLSLRPCLFNAGLTIETVKPGMVLPASLVSVEDHGYAFSLGVDGISAFVPSATLQQCSLPGIIKRPSNLATDKSPAYISASSLVSIPLHSVVTLRIDSVNVAVKVLLCSLPGLNEVKNTSLDSKKQPLRWKGEQYVPLSQRVAWAAIKPGCLVEARVQHVYKREERAEKFINGVSTARLRSGSKVSSLAKCAEEVRENTTHDLGDVIGVRVVCLGGAISGTMLQPHFGHPLLLQFPSDRSSEEVERPVQELNKGGRKQNRQAERGPANEEKLGEGLGSNSDAVYNSKGNETADHGYLSKSCSNVHGGSSSEQKQQSEAGQTSLGEAEDDTSSSTSFRVIQERYFKGCLSRFTRVGARIVARVTCVLSSTRNHVYLSMLPHILTWHPCSLPCSVPELLPGQYLLGATAHVLSVSRFVGSLSQSSSASKKKVYASAAEGCTGDGDVRVLLLHKRKIRGRVAQQSSEGSRKTRRRKEKRAQSSYAEDAADSLHALDVYENRLSSDTEHPTEDSNRQTAGCENNETVVSGAAQDKASREEAPSCGWVLVRIPKCVMAAAGESFKERKSGTKERAASETRTKHEQLPSSNLRPGDVLWSASKESGGGDCFCRVLYFDRFAAEVVGGNSARLLKRGVVLTPFDVAPGQIITVSVLRWRLPVERQSLKQQKRDESLQPHSAGIYVGTEEIMMGRNRVCSPPPTHVFVFSPRTENSAAALQEQIRSYGEVVVPLHFMVLLNFLRTGNSNSLTDTPLSSFPPHVVPGNSLSLRVLGRVCCRSCTDLDREQMLAPFLQKNRRKFAAACQSDRGSGGWSALRPQCSAGLYGEELACGSAVMGIGGGGGGRLMLTGKKSFLNDPHPLTSVVTPKAFHGRLGDAQACCVPLGLIALGYVQEILQRRDLKHGQKGTEEDKESFPSVTVGFYGGLTARLSEDDVRRAVMEEGRTLKLGTVMKVRVLGVDTRYRCLRATLDLTSEAVCSALAAARRKEEKAALRLSPGGLVEKERMTLLTLTDEGVFVAVQEKRQEVESHAFSSGTHAPSGWRTPVVGDDTRARSSVSGSNYQYIPHVGIGFIPKLHLSDGVRLAEELYSVLQVGEQLPLNAVVVSSVAMVRPGLPVSIWKMPEASLDEKASKGGTHFERGLKGALARITVALQQQAVTETDRLQGEQALEALMRDTVILSCKQSLQASATQGTFLRDCKAMEKLKTELHASPPILWGYVRKVGAYGLLVSFGAWQLTGLVPYSNLSDTFVEDESHLRRLYREGMTVRGCIIAVGEADENSGSVAATGGSDDTKNVGARVKRVGLRFLVDVRPKRLSYLQRHRQLEGGARAEASVGIQMLRGLFEGRLLAAALKHLHARRGSVPLISTENYNKRSAKTGTDASVGHGVILKEATSALGDVCDFTPSNSVEKDTSVRFLRPGQLVWGRIFPQDFPNCVLLELQPPGFSSKGEDNTRNKCGSSTCGSITGVMLEHQLPEGETVSSLQARAQDDTRQSQIPCIVLDFDPVTGIADVSCRRRLVDPLQAAQNAIVEAARSAKNQFVHYVLLGVSTPAASEPVTSDQVEEHEGGAQRPQTVCGVPRMTSDSHRVRRRRIEVVTQELNDLIQTDATPFSHQSRNTDFSRDDLGSTPAGAKSSVGQPGTSHHTDKAPSFRVIDPVPEVVIQFAQSFCETQPAPSAIVQLENAAYSVLSADFDLVICFSNSKRLGQKELEVLSYGTPNAGGETAKLVRAIQEGSNPHHASQIGESAPHLRFSGNEAYGLYIRLPLFIFSSSCHNNTLLPVQPAAKALRGGPEDAGWRVALSPLQRSIHLQRGTFAVAVLLAGGCWPMREHKLNRQRNSSHRRDRTEGTGSADRNINITEAGKNPLPTKNVSATQLGGAVECAAAREQILRARVTHVGACMALARLKTPKQQLLLRLHAADALPPQSAQVAHPTPEIDDAFVKINGEHIVAECENSKSTPEPDGSSDKLQASANTGKEQSREEVVERTSWFPPVISPSTSIEEYSGSVWKGRNPLKRLTLGMLIAVRVLRLRALRRPSAERTASVEAPAATGGLQGAADGGQCISDVDKQESAHEHEKTLQKAKTSLRTRSRWVADVELVGWFEKRKTRGEAGKVHYAYIANNASPAPTSGTLSCPGSDGARGMMPWIYSPRWAVVEAVSGQYLTVSCGVRGGVQGSPSMQQLSKTRLERNELKTFYSSDYDDEGALTSSGGRGRVYCLDVSRERRVLQDLKAHFAPGDMVCVRLLPVLSLEEDAFEKLVGSTTRGAAGVDEELTREGSTNSNNKVDYRKPRRAAAVKARYTLVPCPAGMADNLSPKAPPTKAAKSFPAECDVTPAAAPFSLVQTTFDTVADAVDSWARWRYSPGVICWGVIHRMLPPPFAVAVQLCEVVIKKSLKTRSSARTGEDTRRPDNQEDGEQMCGTKKDFLGAARNPLISLPVLAAIHLTEVTDAWQSDPVQQLKLSIGQLVKVRILPAIKIEQAQQPLKHRKTASRSGLPLEASMRMTVVEEPCRAAARSDHKEYRLLTFDDLKVGDRVSGVVVSTGNAGVFVAVSRYLTLRIKLQNLCCSAPPSHKGSDKSLSVISGVTTGAEAEELYPVGKAIRGVRVLELHPDSRRVEGTLRDEIPRLSRRGHTTNEENISANQKPKSKASADTSLISSVPEPVVDTLSRSFDIGDVCEGRVKAIEPFGVFVRLISPRRRLLANRAEDTIDALCHISNIGGATWAERKGRLEKLEIGDLVKACVTRIDQTTGRVWVSLDPGVFSSEGDLEEDIEDVRSELGSQIFGNHNSLEGRESLNYRCDKEKKERSVTTAQKGICADILGLCAPEETSWTWSSAVSATDGMGDEGREAQGGRFAEIEGAEVSHEESHGRVPGRGSTGVKLFGNVDKVHNAAMETQERAGRDDKRREKEEEIRCAEEESSHRSWMGNPRTEEDFEKLVLVSGNSAAVWIRYMAYFVELGDVARARQIAERAVVHINYREEQERFDVWVAYLNLECTYGGAVQTVFKRAIQYNDAKKMYYQMTFIYEKAQKLAEARSACESSCARFPESQKMWIRHLTLLYSTVKDVPAARELMLQALVRLPRRKHVAFAACCARLEYKFGSKERGQTFFEKLIAEHPRRTDLWSQYLDAHICAHTPPRCQPADVQSVRLLFERASSLQLKPRKMKFFFTRWLVFEKRHGTVDSQSLVRERARAYVRAMEARLAERQEN